jgi:DNA-binding NarL/FixJ family response regulator
MEACTPQFTSQRPGLISQETSRAESHLKILVVDDHCLVRDGLKLSLKLLDKRAEVIEAETIRQAIDACRQHPDLDPVLMDLGLPGHTGLEALEALYASCPDARVVIVSGTHDFRTVRAALARGVSGFIPKLSGAAAMINALRFILNGDIHVPPEVFQTSEEQPPLRAAPPPAYMPSPAPLPARTLAAPLPLNWRSPRDAGLTTRQIDVLRLLVEGRSNKQICSQLGLAMGTVKSDVAAILQTLETAAQSQAVAKVDSRGWRDIVLREGRIGRADQLS